MRRRLTFSPLFIGARIVTDQTESNGIERNDFQSPFHRGKDCNKCRARKSLLSLCTFSPLFIGARIVTSSSAVGWGMILSFQSPFHRGKDCNGKFEDHFDLFVLAFSPLFIGARIVTLKGEKWKWEYRVLSVPFSSGQGL